MAKTMVKYEVEGVRDNRRSREALGTLILNGKVRFHSAFQPTEGAWTILLSAKPEEADEVKSALRAFSMTYRSPTYGENFHPPCQEPFYASPEDEIAGKCAPTAQRQLDYWEEKADQGRQ